MTEKVRDELMRMEELNVISKVDISTDWCAGMVVVPKPDGRIRICVGFMKLNEWELRENYPLPEVENLLADIRGSNYFTKLDCNSGFWQEKLEQNSRLLKEMPFGKSLRQNIFRER